MKVHLYLITVVIPYNDKAALSHLDFPSTLSSMTGGGGGFEDCVIYAFPYFRCCCLLDLPMYLLNC